MPGPVLNKLYCGDPTAVFSGGILAAYEAYGARPVDWAGKVTDHESDRVGKDAMEGVDHNARRHRLAGGEEREEIKRESEYLEAEREERMLKEELAREAGIDELLERETAMLLEASEREEEERREREREVEEETARESERERQKEKERKKEKEREEREA